MTLKQMTERFERINRMLSNGQLHDLDQAAAHLDTILLGLPLLSASEARHIRKTAKHTAHLLSAARAGLVSAQDILTTLNDPLKRAGHYGPSGQRQSLARPSSATQTRA